MRMTGHAVAVGSDERSTSVGYARGMGVGYADPMRGLDMALRVHGIAARGGDDVGQLGAVRRRLRGACGLLPLDLH